MVVPPSVKEDISVLRGAIEDNFKAIDPWSLDALAGEKVSREQRRWIQDLRAKRESSASDSGSGGYSDEPPF
jgi:hypothetical protein